MSLLDDLRAIKNFPPSHLPAVSEVLELLGKLVTYVEHGDSFIKAAENDDKARENDEPANHIDELLSPPPKDEPATPATQIGTFGSSPTGTTSSGAPAAAAPAGPSPSAAGAAPADADPRDAEIAQLKQQLATLRAQDQRTETSVTPGPAPASTATPPWGGA